MYVCMALAALQAWCHSKHMHLRITSWLQIWAYEINASYDRYLQQLDELTAWDGPLVTQVGPSAVACGPALESYIQTYCSEPWMSCQCPLGHDTRSACSHLKANLCVLRCALEALVKCANIQTSCLFASLGSDCFTCATMLKLRGAAQNYDWGRCADSSEVCHWLVCLPCWHDMTMLPTSLRTERSTPCPLHVTLLMLAGCKAI